MVDASYAATSKLRPRAMLLVAAMAVVGALMLGNNAPAAHAENHCVSGELCVWVGAFYTGFEGTLGCYSGSIPGTFPEMRSAKNRCGVSEELGWYEGGVYNWKFCMRPGGERPEPGRFNAYRGGAC